MNWKVRHRNSDKIGLSMPFFGLFLDFNLLAPILDPFWPYCLRFVHHLFEASFRIVFGQMFSSILAHLEPQKLCFSYCKSIVSAKSVFREKIDFLIDC